MIIVTGGLGFIGSNIVHILNRLGIDDILVVDDFTDGTKFMNIADARIADYMEKDDFLARIIAGKDFGGPLRAILHQGACSTTTEWDGRFMMANNYQYSKEVLLYCLANRVPLLYASSAAIYGSGTTFVEDQEYDRPLNVYGYSKALFDQYVRRILPSATCQIAGFRYFNVYGPREQHKGSMASVAFHLHNKLMAGDSVKLFTGSGGYGDGEQRRDFVYVEDVINVLLWFLDHPEKSGIFNIGTGSAQSFNDVARVVIATHGRGQLHYIPFPENLKGRYQNFTEADISRLRGIGYDGTFRPVEDGVALYVRWLQLQEAADNQL